MKKIETILNESISIKKEILADEQMLSAIQKVVEIIVDALNNGNKIILCGNGGSAADAQHITAEFVGKFMKVRRSLPAICLNTNVSCLTAIANDFGYEKVFLRQVQSLGQCGDIFLGFSTSGNSQNIIEAFKYASSTDITCVAFTGESGGELKDFADILINVPSNVTPRIQEIHILLAHIICELVEDELF